MRKILILTLIAAASLSACATLGIGNPSETESVGPDSGMGFRRGMEPGSGMMDRHHAQIPNEFAGLTNPVPADDESLARGETVYTTHCATCHGDYGNGDGPGGASLDPAPAAIAHTSQMLSDAYLFWHITEGGVPFGTAMIAYRDILDEQARWDVINYVRALGRGQVQPGQMMGGQPFNPEVELAQRAEMLAEAIQEGVITQEEADIFDTIHTVMDEYLMVDSVSGMGTGNRADALPQILGALVVADEITQDRADVFLDVHDRLIEAGLME